MFPIASNKAPEATADRVGNPETANGRLLHGARHHDRRAVFLSWERVRGGGWQWADTPDWRADRHSIRAGLVLSQRLGLGEGDPVAIALAPGVDLAVLERGAWSVGAVSVPIDPAWELARVAEVLAHVRPAVLFAGEREWVDALRTIGGLPDSVRATVVARGLEEADEETLSFASFLDYGGVLDTPERASMWRTTADAAPPERLIALEYTERPGDLEPARLDQRGLVAEMNRISAAYPPRTSGLRVLMDGAPTREARALIYAGWGDGITTTVFAGSPEAQKHLEALPGPESAGEPEVATATAGGNGVLILDTERLRIHASRSNGAGNAFKGGGHD